jgi:four helix bundle protein
MDVHRSWEPSMTDPERFPFEELDAHKVAMQLMEVVTRIADRLPRGNSDLRAHLVTSARSIHLNIAEGSGSEEPGTKASRYGSARGSANECASGLREVRMFRLADPRLLNQADNYLHRLGMMLTRLIQYWKNA